MAKEQGIIIKEKYPDGKNSVKSIVDLIDRSEKLADDGRPLWAELLQPIEDAMSYEFSHANPNNWPGLKPETIDWKRSKGFPDTIGIMDGALKRASTNEAVIDSTKEALLWGVNPNVTGYKGAPVGDYAQYFNDGSQDGTNPARPLFGFTKKWVKNNIIDLAVKLWVNIGWSKG